jgi:putative transposase
MSISAGSKRNTSVFPKHRLTYSRLRWMDYYAQYGNARLTCRHFDISPQTFYRWKRRFDPYDLTTLEDESRRPDHVRIPRIPAAVVERVLTLRQKYPRWGKDKLVVLLKKEGIQISTSSVGRVMKRLKDRGVLVEPLNVRLARAARKRRWKPRYAIRKPPGYSWRPCPGRYDSDPSPERRRIQVQEAF